MAILLVRNIVIASMLLLQWGIFLQMSDSFVLVHTRPAVSRTPCFAATKNACHHQSEDEDSGNIRATGSCLTTSTVSRRDSVAAALFSAAAILLSPVSSMAVLEEQAEGRLIQFDVANLDGVEGNTGSFTIQLHPSWAPRGSERFEELTESGFWNGCRFFRVLPGFVSQFGINGDPSIQAQWRSKSIADDKVQVSNRRGTVVFATSGPNTRTTQIFINTGDRNSFLDGQGFSPFGEVISGMDVVDRFYSGYGEGAPQGKGPSQAMMQVRGGNYVNSNFPKLSYITNAKIVR